MAEYKEKIFYVTGNPGKLASAQNALNPHGIEVVQVKMQLIEPQYDSIEEIVASKVKQAYQQLGRPCLAQDSGLMIDAWPGFPGAYTEFVQRTIGNPGILKLMQGIINREAKFVRCLAYMGKNIDKPIFFYSHNPGFISCEERGTYQAYHWSRLSLIFVPHGSEATLAEMDQERYHSVVRSPDRISGEEQFARWLTNQFPFFECNKC